MPYEIVLDQGDEDSLGGPCFELGVVADLCKVQSAPVEQDVGDVLVDATSEVSAAPIVLKRVSACLHR